MRTSSDPETRGPVTRPGRATLVRVIRFVAALLGAVVAGGGLFLASAPGKALALRSAAALVRTRMGVEARAGGLGYRILSGGVTLYDVTVTEPGAARPFLRAKRVDLDLSPGLLVGSPALRGLHVSGPEIVLDRTTRVVPAAGRSPDASPAAILPFNIQRLDLRDLALTAEGPDGTAITVRGLTLALAATAPGELRGEIVISDGWSARRPAFGVGFDRARADVTVAGTALSLSSISMDSPVATVAGTARIDLDGGDFDVKYDARLKAGELRQWWPDSPIQAGDLEASGTVGGTLEAVAAVFAVSGTALRWQGVPDGSLSASGHWSDAGLVLDRFEVASRASGAHASGLARLASESTGRSSVQLDARAADLNRIARLAGAPALPAVPLTLAADLAWRGAVPDPSTVEGHVRLVVPTAGSPHAPLATVDARGRAGRWTLRERTALEGGTSMVADMTLVVHPTAFSRSAIGGRIAAQSGSLIEALRDLQQRGLPSASLEPVLGRGRAAADATLSGTLASPRLEARLTADALSLAGVEEIRAEARIRLDRHAVEVSMLRAESPGNRLDAHGTVTAGADPLHLTVAARLEEPGRLAGFLPPEWRPAGSLVLSGTVDGSASAPRVAARISGSRLEANGIAVDTLEGHATFEHGLLQVSDLFMSRGEGWLRLDGGVSTNLDHLNIRGRGGKLAVESPQLALSVHDLAVDFDIAGSIARPTGTLSATAGEAAFEGRALGPVHLSAGAADRSVRFDLALTSLGADVAGAVGLEAGWPFEAHANLRGSQLTSLAALVGPSAAPPDTSGRLTASADVTGHLDRPFDSTAIIRLAELTGEFQGKPFGLRQPGRIRLDGRRPTVEEPLHIAVGGISLGLSALGDRGTGALVAIEGRLEDGLAFLPATVPIAPWLVEGLVRAQVSLTQEANRMAIAGHADATLDRLAHGDRELARGVGLRAQVRDGTIELSEAAGTILGSPFTATARVPLAWAVPAWLAEGASRQEDLAPAEATVSARAEARLAPALESLAIESGNFAGSMTMALEARARAPRLEDVEATLVMEAGELSVGKVSSGQQGPITLRLSDGRLEIAELAWKGPRTTLAASGAIGLLPGTDGELRARGTSSMSLLGMFAPGLEGKADFDVVVSGPPGIRRASGTVDLDEVSFISPQWQLALAGLSGTLTLDADVVETRGLRGQLNGGELEIEGAIPVRPGVVAPRPLRVEGRGLFVEIPRGLRSQLDTSLTWEHAAAGSRLSGRVSVASDTYREPITTLLASLSGGLPGGQRALPPWVAATALDISVSSAGPIVVDQNMLRVELVPDVRFTGTVERPALSGQVAIQDDGRIHVAGRTYRLLESRVEFSPGAGFMPRVNLVGETRVSSYLVTMRMLGPADEVETNFSSDPPLSDRDVRSLLVTGQTTDPTRGRSDSDTLAIGTVSGGVLGTAGRFVGLDSVRVGTEDLDLVSRDVDPATRLTASKRLGAKFELLLSENLDENESTWIVVYRPVSGYEIWVSSEDTTKQAIEFRQEITFGPGVSPRGGARAAAVARDRVRSVSLAGEPGFPPDEVLAATKIRADDRFEFTAWLNDRDRIVQFYRDRGYYKARVVPMRSMHSSTGTERLVDLQYKIARGRQTLLEVTGYTAGDDFVESLRRAWSENVLDELLSERLGSVARDHLVDAGFLRAAIEVDVDRPEPDTERARVHIEPGPRSGSRQLAFIGNRALAAETLHELAASTGLEGAAWKDAGPLIDAIRAAYAAKGFLRVRVAAEAVRFATATATLPIRIEEGPPAHVASLELTGAAPERRAGALEAVGLPPGSAFAAGMDRAGRTRLERYYRDLGYRDVRVDMAATAASTSSDVTLAFTVNEGPLHVVRSVEIAGVQSTRPSLVRKAVDLAPGDPAGAATQAAIERQLYSLGTFRRAELRLEPDPAPSSPPGILPVKAVVAVEEPRRFRLRYGIERSTEYISALAQRTDAWGLAADIRDGNFLGRGMSLGGGARYEPDLWSVRTLFSVPTLAGHPIRTNVYLTGRGEEDGNEQIRVQDDEIDLSIEQRWRVGEAVEYYWAYTANWRDTELAPVTGGVPLAFVGTLASVNGAVVLDRRDSFFDARRGWFGSMSLQWGKTELGSDLDYLRTLVRGSYYQPLGPLVLAGNVRWGRLVPLGGVAPLTIFDLFFNAGGTESVRGYAQDSLTAYEFLGAPLGGTKLLVLNGELRAPLFWRLGGVLFADAGNTFAEQQAMRFQRLGIGLGFGIRVNTPLAPIRLDLGFPRSFGESGTRVHVSIGQMF